MSDYVLHDRTTASLELFARQPSHALLIAGPSGAGKGTVAQLLSSRILKSSPYLLHIKPIKNSISIDEIRQAQAFVKLKTSGTESIRRVIIVEDAQTLGLEAQNAFLKLLEEPPADTIIILTASDTQALLPTIRSRVQLYNLQPPSKPQLIEYFNRQGHSDVEITSAYHVSNGQPGLMSAILNDKDDSETSLDYIKKAKELLAQPAFERLAMADKLLKQKTELPKLLWALQRVATAAMQSAASKNNNAQLSQWQGLVQKLIKAQDSLGASPQAKLLLTDLLLSY